MRACISVSKIQFFEPLHRNSFYFLVTGKMFEETGMNRNHKGSQWNWDTLRYHNRRNSKSKSQLGKSWRLSFGGMRKVPFWLISCQDEKQWTLKYTMRPWQGSEQESDEWNPTCPSISFSLCMTMLDYMQESRLGRQLSHSSRQLYCILHIYQV